MIDVVMQHFLGFALGWALGTLVFFYLHTVRPWLQRRREVDARKQMFRDAGFTVRDTPHGWEARRDD